MANSETQSEAPSWLTWVQRVAVPVIMCAVIGAQFWAVKNWNVSRWRGGGFGMYSDYHPNTRHFWLTPAIPSAKKPTLVAIHRERQKYACPFLTTIIMDCRRKADDVCQRRLSLCLDVPDHEGATINGYHLDFDPERKTLNRKEFVSWPYRPPKPH